MTEIDNDDQIRSETSLCSLKDSTRVKVIQNRRELATKTRTRLGSNDGDDDDDDETRIEPDSPLAERITHLQELMMTMMMVLTGVTLHEALLTEWRTPPI